MSVQNVSVEPAGQVGIIPRIVRIQCTDTYAQITTAGYLNSIGLVEGVNFSASDFYIFNYGDQNQYIGTFAATITAGVLTLAAQGTVSSSTANHFAIFTDTTGSLGQDAATAINGGNIQAGLSGTAGYLASFPATASKGSLHLTAVANTGNTVTTISNAAMGQASVVSIPDPAAATANFVLAPAALVSGNLVKASGTAGLIVDAGFTSPASDASANADATTIAVPLSSNGAGSLSFANTLPRYATGSLTLSQIQNAYTTPIELIPAPGANLMVVIHSFVLELIYGSAAYTGGGAAYLQYGATAHGTNYATLSTDLPATLFTGLGASTAVSCNGNINTTTGLATSACGNAAVTYTNATAVFAVGTGGSARWYVYYSIVPIT